MIDEIDTTKEMTDEEIITTAKERFELVSSVESEQREREQEDLQFQVPDMQWDEDAKRQRRGYGGGDGDGAPRPARPILSIPKIDQPVQMVLNQQQAAQLGVHIEPLSPDADDEIADIVNGIYRKIERVSNAHQARSWAFDRAVKAGRGWYRIGTKFDDDGGFPFDQNLTIERILYQESVYMDPAAQKPDYSDAEWAFVTTRMSKAEFKRKFPDARLANGEDNQWSDAVEGDPKWITDHDIQVCEYFYKQHVPVILVLLADGTIVQKDQMPKDIKLAIIAERPQDKVIVRYCKLTGDEILEKGQWNGSLIPLVPVFGRELQPFDKERRYIGMINTAKDAQRIVNYAASQAIESAALEPKVPWLVAEGQIEGYEHIWARANTDNITYLPYKQFKDDQLATPYQGPPQRAQVDGSKLQMSMQLFQLGDNFIMAATGAWEPSQGRLSGNERSGKAIMALQQQSDASSSHFLQSLANVSMQYEARVILDAMPRIYDRPGRLVRTLDQEEKNEVTLINQPFFVDPKTRRPVPVQVQMNPETGEPLEPLQPLQQLPPLPNGNPPRLHYYNLQKGVYSVSVNIGRSKSTLSAEAADELGQMIQAQPNLFPIVGPLYVKLREFPGADELAKMLQKMRDQQFPFLVESEDGMLEPEQAQQKIMEMEQQLQQAQQQIEQAGQIIQQKQIEKQADAQVKLQTTQMETQSREKIAGVQSQTDLMIAELRAYMSQQSDQIKAIQQMLERQAKANLSADQHDHEHAIQQSKEAADLVKAVMTPSPSSDLPLQRRNPEGIG